MLRRGRRKIAPAIEIVGQKIICRIGRNDLGVALIKERESPARRADINRLPEAVEHQDLTIQERLHLLRKLRRRYHPRFFPVNARAAPVCRWFRAEPAFPQAEQASIISVLRIRISRR